METELAQSAVVFPWKAIDDWYTREGEIGRGTFGVVYLATDDRVPLLRLKYGILVNDMDDAQVIDHLVNDDPTTCTNAYLLERAESSEDLAKTVLELARQPDNQMEAAQLLSRCEYESLHDMYMFLPDLPEESAVPESSRLLIIFEVLEHLFGWNRTDFLRTLKGSEGLPSVAIKITDLSTVTYGDEARVIGLINSVRTEVFAQANVACECVVLLSPQTATFTEPEKPTKHVAIIEPANGGLELASINLQKSSTVAWLKQAIQKKTDIPVAKQYLKVQTLSQPLMDSNVNRDAALINDRFVLEYFSPDALARETNLFFSLAIAESPTETTRCLPIISCMRDYFRTGRMGDAYAIVFDYVDGDTLYIVHEKLYYIWLEEARTSRNLKLPLSDEMVETRGYLAWYTAFLLSWSLYTIHTKGIIHNDVKLENVIYARSDGSETLIDLGLSCRVDLGRRRAGLGDACDGIGGTINSVAPEVLNLRLRYPVSDIWSLGIILWELAVGIAYNAPGKTDEEKVFSISHGAKPNVVELDPRLPHVGSLRTLINSCLQIDPKARLTAEQVNGFVMETFAEEFQLDDRFQVGEQLRQLAYERVAAQLATVEETGQMSPSSLISPLKYRKIQ